jgi:hypothetical protein
MLKKNKLNEAASRLLSVFTFISMLFCLFILQHVAALQQGIFLAEEIKLTEKIRMNE